MRPAAWVLLLCALGALLIFASLFGGRETLPMDTGTPPQVTLTGEAP